MGQCIVSFVHQTLHVLWFYEFNTVILVQLEGEVAERTLALKKKTRQLVESRRQYEDRLRQQRQQQQQALRQAREAIQSLNGRSKQELEEMLENLYTNLLIQAQRAECKVCFDEEVQVLFLPCKHLVTCEKCANHLNKCPTCRKNILKKKRAFLA